MINLTIEEMRERVETLRAEARSLNDENKLDEAEAKLNEIREIKKKIKIQEQLEEEEREKLKNKETQIRGGDDSMEKRGEQKELEYRALVKAMLGKNLTQEERAAITDGNFNSNTGAIIPSEFVNKVDLYRSGKKSLKSYCDVIPVSTDNGKMPTAYLDDELADLEEDVDMVETMVNMAEIDFKVTDKGLLKKVGNNVLDDGAVNFIDGILAPNFATASVNRENKDIMKVVGVNSKVVAIPAEGKVEDILAKTISKADDNIADGLVIVTNVEGYSYLDNLRDGSGRKSDDVTYINGVLYFKNKEVIKIADSKLPALTSEKTMVFYITNLKTVKFFDRKVMEIAKSTEAGFKANKTYVRVIERYDVKANPEEKIKAAKIEA